MSDGTYMHNGKKWFFFLKDKNFRNRGLLSQATETELEKKITVCWELPYAGSTTRLFSYFNNPKELHVYMESTTGRYFHEVIFGYNSRKPIFDIDMEITDEIEDPIRKGEGVKDAIICGICQVMEELGIKFDKENILVFSSHGSKKRSYHIVVDGYYHLNFMEAKKFFSLVLSKACKIFMECLLYLDDAIYSSKHNIRILGSQKSERIKIYEKDPGLTYSYEMLERSLVTNWQKCKLLPIKADEYRENNIKNIDISSTLLGNIIDKLGGDFKFRDITGNRINLQRLKPSDCLLCGRCHEKENAFLVVYQDRILFKCMRNKEGFVNVLTGDLTNEVKIYEKQIQEENEEGTEGGFFGLDLGGLERKGGKHKKTENRNKIGGNEIGEKVIEGKITEGKAAERKTVENKVTERKTVDLKNEIRKSEAGEKKPTSPKRQFPQMKTEDIFSIMGID